MKLLPILIANLFVFTTQPTAQWTLTTANAHHLLENQGSSKGRG